MSKPPSNSAGNSLVKQLYREYMDSAVSKILRLFGSKSTNTADTVIQPKSIILTPFNRITTIHQRSWIKNFLYSINYDKESIKKRWGLPSNNNNKSTHYTNTTNTVTAATATATIPSTDYIDSSGRIHRQILWFDDTTDLNLWKAHNDQQFGGKSTAELSIKHLQPSERFITTDNNNNSINLLGSDRSLVFSGELHELKSFRSIGSRWIDERAGGSIITPSTASASASAAAAGNNSNNQSNNKLLNGFCSCISPKYEWPDLNLSKYQYLRLIMRTDGRPYIFSIRCRERFPLVYQSRIPAEIDQNRPLHSKEIKFNNFITTFRGEMQSLQVAIPLNKIESFGFSLSGATGPFRLELLSIEAVQGIADYERTEYSTAELIEAQNDINQSNTESRSLWWLDSTIDRKQRAEINKGISTDSSEDEIDNAQNSWDNEFQRERDNKSKQ